ncbi:MAG: hypothetical protein JWN22_2840 [Nocardioides sp.]|jgi:hypothetical protein|nr:hypothetical protein [Nocardioides sp.]
MPAFEDVAAVLTYIDVDPIIANEILFMLRSESDTLAAQHVSAVPGGVLGPTESAALLAHHTSIAHRHVAEAMSNMVTGLEGFAANLNTYLRHLDDADDTTVVSFSGMQAYLGCLVTPDLAAPSGCPTSPEALT